MAGWVRADVENAYSNLPLVLPSVRMLLAAFVYLADLKTSHSLRLFELPLYCSHFECFQHLALKKKIEMPICFL